MDIPTESRSKETINIKKQKSIKFQNTDVIQIDSVKHFLKTLIKLSNLWQNKWI
jgi:hypothetical protein